MTTIPEKYSDLLERDVLAHVATVGPDGEPQNNPVWFGWDGKYLRFSQTTTRQKYRNVRREPRVALSIVDPANPYRYLEIRGRVVDIENDPEKRFIDAMARKYMGVDEYPNKRADEHRVIVVVEPEHTTHMG